MTADHPWISTDLDPAEIMSIVQECSTHSLSFFRAGTSIDNKWTEGFDPVTQADREVEKLLTTRLAEHFGELPVIGEEHGTSGDPSAGLAWIIDPIDGTRAFISGQPQWGTLLGLLDKGAPVGGWMYLPVLQESFWAVGDLAGGSSPLGALRRETSDCTQLSEATLVSTHPSMFEGDDADRFWQVESMSKLSRFNGDCHNYALLANGDIDLVVENQMETYDILPLVPIVEAAGGVVTDGAGNPPLQGGMIIAAATPELHAAALAVMTGVRPAED
jgi:histidinol phosphatase-like enzyme (inositol monophosphatase family)